MSLGDSAKGLPAADYEFIVSGGKDRITAKNGGEFQPVSLTIDDGGDHHGDFVNILLWWNPDGSMQEQSARVAIAMGGDPAMDDKEFDVRNFGGKRFSGALKYDKNDFQQIGFRNTDEALAARIGDGGDNRTTSVGETTESTEDPL